MQQFLDELRRRHLQAAVTAYPSTSAVNEFANNFINWLFPEYTGKVMADLVLLEEYAHMLQLELQHLLQPMQQQLPAAAEQLSQQFMAQAPVIYDELNKYAEAIYKGDPAATCLLPHSTCVAAATYTFTAKDDHGTGT